MAEALLRAASPNRIKGLENTPTIGRTKRPPNARTHSHGTEFERVESEDDTSLPTCPPIFFNGSTNGGDIDTTFNSSRSQTKLGRA
jgi:hypothetical protein